MTTLSTAWAKRASSPVSMLHLGDSITEGTGAGGFEAKWTTKLLRGLQSAAGISGGSGWVNTGSYAAADNSLSTFYNPVAGTVAQGSGLLGNRVGQFSANQAITVTFTGTSVALYFFENYSGAQPFTVSIDGGTAVSVPVSTTGTQDDKGTWHSPTLAHGTHTALVTPASGATMNLVGIYVFDGDETNGVHGWDAGHAGDVSGNPAGNPTGYYQQGCQVAQPTVATLFFGVNDYYQSVPPATYQANLTSLISAVDSYCTAPLSWVICGQYDVGGTPGSYAQSAYRSAAQAVANADTVNRRYVDLSTVGVALGSDNTHPSPAGHATIASALQPAVLDLAGASSSGWSSLVAERWTGSAWQPLAIEKWNGTAWVTATAERSA